MHVDAITSYKRNALPIKENIRLANYLHSIQLPAIQMEAIHGNCNTYICLGWTIFHPLILMPQLIQAYDDLLCNCWFSCSWRACNSYHVSANHNIDANFSYWQIETGSFLGCNFWVSIFTKCNWIQIWKTSVLKDHVSRICFSTPQWEWNLVDQNGQISSLNIIHGKKKKT